MNAAGMPHGAMPPADAAESTVRFSDAYQRQHWCEGLGCWIPEHVVNAQAGPVLANGSRVPLVPLVPLVAVGDGGAVLAIHAVCLDVAQGRTPSLFADPGAYFVRGAGPLEADARCCAGRSCHYAPCEHYGAGACGCRL